MVLNPSHSDASTAMDDCEDGDVGLVGGPNSTVGRLEVCINRAWGTVCNRRFGTNEALVVCQQLGFSSGEGFFMCRMCCNEYCIHRRSSNYQGSIRFWSSSQSYIPRELGVHWD